MAGFDLEWFWVRLMGRLRVLLGHATLCLSPFSVCNYVFPSLGVLFYLIFVVKLVKACTNSLTF